MASDFRCLLLSPENAPFDEFIFSIKFCEIFQGFIKKFQGFSRISRASKIFQGFPGFPGPVRTLWRGSVGFWREGRGCKGFGGYLHGSVVVLQGLWRGSTRALEGICRVL